MYINYSSTKFNYYKYKKNKTCSKNNLSKSFRDININIVAL